MSYSEMYEKSLRAFLKPVARFLDDKSITEIMINGPTDVWIERGGRLFKTTAQFTPEGLDAAARNMAQFVGRILDEERPRLDARLPDGSRIHVVMPPIGRKGTTISIRKFFPGKLTVSQLVEFGSLTKPMARFIDACVVTAKNLLVSGGTGSGKTTLLNVLSSLIPNEERILTIEDSAELQLVQDHLVPFESRPPDKHGRGGVNMTDLLRTALRMRPDRIIIGEVRGGEAFDLIQSMNTGHSGSMATVHANTPVDTLRRIESLCLMSTVDMPLVAVRAQVAAAIHVVVCANRFHDGSRRITHISEVLPLDEKGDYRTQDIFVYSMTGKDEQGNVQGYHAPTGILPTFLHQLHTYGFEELTEDFFDPGSYGLEQPKVSAVHQFQVRWVERLQGGKEQWDAKPFDRNHLQKLEQGFALTLTERDLVPPPMADAQPRSEPATREPPQVPPATSPRQEPADPRLRTTEARRPTQPSEPQNESGSGRPASRASGQLLARQLERQKAQQRSEPRRPDRLGLGPRPRPTGSPSEPEDDA